MIPHLDHDIYYDSQRSHEGASFHQWSKRLTDLVNFISLKKGWSENSNLFLTLYYLLNCLSYYLNYWNPLETNLQLRNLLFYHLLLMHLLKMNIHFIYLVLYDHYYYAGSGSCSLALMKKDIIFLWFIMVYVSEMFR